MRNPLSSSSSYATPVPAGQSISPAWKLFRQYLSLKTNIPLHPPDVNPERSFRMKKILVKTNVFSRKATLSVHFSVLKKLQQQYIKQDIQIFSEKK